MKDIALCSAARNWAILGKYDNKKAFLTLKNPDAGSIFLSEKDLKPVIGLLETTRLYMKEAGK
jgi:hypothetical protein